MLKEAWLRYDWSESLQDCCPPGTLLASTAPAHAKLIAQPIIGTKPVPIIGHVIGFACAKVNQALSKSGPYGVIAGL